MYFISRMFRETRQKPREITFVFYIFFFPFPSFPFANAQSFPSLFVLYNNSKSEASWTRDTPLLVRTGKRALRLGRWSEWEMVRLKGSLFAPVFRLLKSKCLEFPLWLFHSLIHLHFTFLTLLGHRLWRTSQATSYLRVNPIICF